MRAVLRLQQRAPVLVALVLLLVVWEIVGRSGISTAVPPLAGVLDGFQAVAREPTLVDSIAASLRELVIGFAIALAIGLPVGAAMGLFKPVEEALDVYVNMFMGAPMAAFVPLLVAIFGVGPASIIATIVVFSIFMIIVSTYAGVKNADPVLLQMARSYGASRAQTVRKVVLPGAMPMILTGVRLGFGRAVAGMVLGEMLVVVVGFGGLIMTKGSSFQVEQLWALIIMIVGFAVIVSWGLEMFQRRRTSWAVSHA